MTEVCAGGGSVSKLKVKVLRNKNQCFKRKKRYIYTSIPKKNCRERSKKGQEGIMLMAAYIYKTLFNPGLKWK